MADSSSTPTLPAAVWRLGAVKKRTQLKTKMMGEAHWTKRDKNTGKFMDVKKSQKKFKGVRKEKKKAA